MTSLLQKQSVSVSAEGELVVLRIGNAEMKMDHETAIQLSTWLRIRGKESKRLAGDNSRHWSVVGKLAAIEAGDRPW
jgi:hypothetical protein